MMFVQCNNLFIILNYIKDNFEEDPEYQLFCLHESNQEADLFNELESIAFMEQDLFEKPVVDYIDDITNKSHRQDDFF